MDKVKEFTETLLFGLVKKPDILKVQDFEGEDGDYILEIIVHHDDMPTVIGKSGVNAKAIKSLIQTCAHIQGIKRVNVNIDSI